MANSYRDGRESWVMPSSFVQACWFLNASEGLVFDNVPNVWRLQGPLDTTALEQALSELVCRHEALRTTLSSGNGDVHQVVHPASSVQLRMVELPLTEHRPLSSRLLGRAIDAEIRQPFDLRTPPLVRTALVRLGPRDHLLIVTAAHVIWDAQSSAIFIRDLACLYRAGVQGETCHLPDLPIQFGDFAAWERQHVNQAACETLCRGSPPGDGASRSHSLDPAPQTRLTAAQEVASSAIADVLRRRTAGLGATDALRAFVAFAALVSETLGVSRPSVAIVLSTREAPETRDLIGCFLGYAWIHTEIDASQRFDDAVLRLKRPFFDALGSAVPLERLVEQLEVNMTVSSPVSAKHRHLRLLFDYLFNFIPSTAVRDEISIQSRSGTVILTPISLSSRAPVYPTDVLWHGAPFVVTLSQSATGAIDCRLLYRYHEPESAMLCGLESSMTRLLRLVASHPDCTMTRLARLAVLGLRSPGPQPT